MKLCWSPSTVRTLRLSHRLWSTPTCSAEPSHTSNQSPPGHVPLNQVTLVTSLYSDVSHELSHSSNQSPLRHVPYPEPDEEKSRYCFGFQPNVQSTLARSRAADSSCKHLTTDARRWMLVLATTAGFKRTAHTAHTAHSGVD